jgi:nucleoside-diphosphate-sugar epimerase
MNWQDHATLVTGGASCIGSKLVEKLIERGARVRVVDDLSNGKLENIQSEIDAGQVDFVKGSLLEQEVARKAVTGIGTVFQLAADHGGRGYVDTFQAGPATNMALDGITFTAAKDAGVERIVYASSACVYPNFLQTQPEEVLYLTEDKVGPPFDADNMYGWAKLMAEKTLQAYATEYGMKTASCRYFTVFGPGATESHAVIAMIARAFVKQDPYVVWGNGEQIRNWTYVDDIVEGTILAAENIEDGSAVNIGTMERTRVLDAVKLIMDFTGHSAEVELHPEMPTGPMNRVADNSRAKELFGGWQPQTSFADGVQQTIDWYFSTHERDEVAARLEQALTGR